MRRPIRPIFLPHRPILRRLSSAVLFLIVLSRTAVANPAVPNSASDQRRQAQTLAAHASYIDAIPYYRAALAIDRSHSTLDACTDLNGLAEAFAFAGDNQSALRAARQARTLESRLSPRTPQTLLIQARTLRLMGEIADDTNQSDTAKALDRKALTFAPDDANSERGWVLADLGDLANNDNDVVAADQDDQQALAIAKRAQDTRLTASVEARIGDNLIGEKKYEDAVRRLQSARNLAQACGDRQTEDHALGDLCLALVSLKRYDESFAAADEGLRIARAIQDLRGEKTLLHNQGYANFRLSNYQAARDSYTKMLSIAIRIHDAQDQCAVLGDLGNVAVRLSEFGAAVQDFRKAVRIAERLGDQDDQGTNLALLCGAYVEVGQYTPALISGYLALSICKREGGDGDGDAAICWGNLGRAYLKRTQYLEALHCYQTALALDRKIKERREEGNILGKIGEADWLLHRYPEASAALTDALTIARATQDKDAQQWAIYNLGNVKLDEGQFRQAVSLFETALASAGLTHERRLQAYANSRLMTVAREQKRISLAIWYGKRSVDGFQRIRAGLGGLDRNDRRSFVQSKESIYRALADLLVSAGRISEAEHVLGMLKEEEYFDFIGQTRDAAPQADADVEFTPDERQWLAEYDRLGETAEQAQQEVTACSQIDRPTPAQQAQASAASKKLAAANDAYQKLRDNLINRFDQQDQAAGHAVMTAVKNNEAVAGLLQALSRTGRHVVELYTVEADSQYDVILQTPNSIRWGAYPISAVTLNALVERFRNAVKDPSADSRPLGNDLYRILVGPVERDLTSYKPDVVMWSLDGPLGLVPVSALWDGHQYLVQRWENTLFNPASTVNLMMSGTPPMAWKNALGMGVSKVRTVGSDVFPELAGVPLELNAVIHDPTHGDSANGVLPGRFYLDDEFTAENTLKVLSRHNHSVVHIASHFKLSAAGMNDSYLLCGGGQRLTLAQIDAALHIFDNVDLLTLSACSTAVSTRGADADRNTLDSLDLLAERRGARSVIATLWDVSDESTALLMQTFYRALVSDPAARKGKSLRAAQLALLTGRAAPSGALLRAARARGTVAMRAASDQNVGVPAYPRDPSRPYAHPYYWAPFVLLGDWK